MSWVGQLLEYITDLRITGVQAGEMGDEVVKEGMLNRLDGIHKYAEIIGDNSGLIWSREAIKAINNTEQKA